MVWGVVLYHPGSRLSTLLLLCLLLLLDQSKMKRNLPQLHCEILHTPLTPPTLHPYRPHHTPRPRTPPPPTPRIRNELIGW